MKAISLRQPYASLVLAGCKRLDWREWSTDYRGPVAIHISKSVSPIEHKIAYHPIVRQLLRGLGYTSLASMPVGVIAGSCILQDCTPTESTSFTDMEAIMGWPECPYLLHYEAVTPLASPFEWKGKQQLWDLPDNLAVRLGLLKPFRFLNTSS